MNQHLYRYAGNPEQMFGVRKVQCLEGRAAGCTIIEAYTAEGLRVDILPDTGLDLGAVHYRGKNMSFISKNGYDSPNTNLPYETEFINTFSGGMLYTCGLRSTGPANRDGDEWHPVHGRFHSLRASEVCASVQGEQIVVSGTLRESALFGHCLQVKRQITLPVNGSTITVEDTIQNLTPRPEEFMLLYHYNFGYPMLSEKAKLVLPHKRKTTPRTDFAAEELEQALEFDSPVDSEEERVFFHELSNPWARLENSELEMAATLRWSGDSLPILVQWRSMASGDYALGLEPSNSYIKGRAEERKNGTLRTIAGFESVKTKLTLDFQTL